MDRDSILQTYYHLYQQSTLLQQSLTARTPSPPSRRSSTHSTGSPTSALPSPTHSQSEEEAALRETNRQIKVVLTALLNCDGVRGDTQMRAWVQERLMTAEQDLRRRRRGVR